MCHQAVPVPPPAYLPCFPVHSLPWRLRWQRRMHSCMQPRRRSGASCSSSCSRQRPTSRWGCLLLHALFIHLSFHQMSTLCTSVLLGRPLLPVLCFKCSAAGHISALRPLCDARKFGGAASSGLPAYAATRCAASSLCFPHAFTLCVTPGLRCEPSPHPCSPPSPTSPPARMPRLPPCAPSWRAPRPRWPRRRHSWSRHRRPSRCCQAGVTARVHLVVLRGCLHGCPHLVARLQDPCIQFQLPPRPTCAGRGGCLCSRRLAGAGGGAAALQGAGKEVCGGAQEDPGGPGSPSLLWATHKWHGSVLKVPLR